MVTIHQLAANRAHPGRGGRWGRRGAAGERRGRDAVGLPGCLRPLVARTRCVSPRPPLLQGPAAHRGTSPAELEDAASSCGRAGGVLWQSQGELGSGVLLLGDAAPHGHRSPAPAGVTSRTLRWRTGYVTRFVPTDRWHERRPGRQPDPQCWAMISIIRRVLFGTSVGVGLALFGIPAAVSVLGFKAGGIAAGSMAAKMMSAAAIANNGGVAAGSTVAVLQSVGALLPVGRSGHYQKGELEGLGGAEGAEPLHGGELAWELQDSLLVPKLGCHQPWGHSVE
ncbi:uncharacterized protein [Anas acuta]|uniref:uncharacterized protein n=1 Tax=Anas acuta TaxID=28680 RepID=UPI0035C8CC7C